LREKYIIAKLPIKIARIKNVSGDMLTFYNLEAI